MAAELGGDRLLALLLRLAELLDHAGEARTSAVLRHLADGLEGQSPGTEGRRAVVRQILRLYGGMGSFQDLVLQDAGGVRPEQRDLQSLRHQLFEEARTELR